MTISLQLGEFGRPRIAGRTLVLLCAYRGGTRAKPPLVSFRGAQRVWNWLTLRPLSAHVAAYRDHQANPRPLGTQIELARAALALGQASTVRTVIDEGFAGDEIGDLALGDSATEIFDLSNAIPSLAGADTVILVYPDALGLGFGGLETRLRRGGAKNIVVLTGRRRIFPLTSEAMRAFRWRRILARTRLVELAAAAAVIPIAVVLTCYDSLWKHH